jgi:tetratricopeptide (TPR) repeat protein
VVGMLAIAPSGGETGDAYAIPARDFASIYRSTTGADPQPPPAVAELRKVCRALSAELGEWRQFISSRADAGWINHANDTPPVSAWHEHRDVLARVAPETLTGNLEIVYSYFETLRQVYDLIQSHFKEEASYKYKHNIRDPQASIVEGLAHITVLAGYGGALYLSMRYKQTKDQEFQTRLRALPDAISTLIHELDILNSASSRREQGRLASVRLPALPHITSVGGSISFKLIPIEASQEFPAAGAETVQPPRPTTSTPLFPELEAAFREAMRLAPGNAKAHSGPADAVGAQYRIEEIDEAEAGYREAIRLDPGQADAHYFLGMLLNVTERHEEAEAAYREAIRLDPGQADAHIFLGMLLFFISYRLPEAEAAFREAIRLDPGRAPAHNGLGLVLLDLGRYAEAEGAFREVIRLSPSDALAYHGLGTVLLDLGRHEEGVAALREAVRLNPDYAEAYRFLAAILLAMERYAEAEGAFREAIRLSPGSAKEHYGHGVALRQLKRYREADAAWKEAVRLDPAYRRQAGSAARILRRGLGHLP